MFQNELSNAFKWFQDSSRWHTTDLLYVNLFGISSLNLFYLVNFSISHILLYSNIFSIHHLFCSPSHPIR